MSKPFILTIVLVGLAASPASVLAVAETSFLYGGWLPFWEKQSGVGNITANLDKLNELSPFSYEVNPDGTLKDSFKTTGATADWLKALHDLRIAIVPTVAWLNGDQIHALISDKKKRKAHVANIAAMVLDNKFDGVDIDYEDKNAETRPYFSAFIKELAEKLHSKKKKLACTVEPRTPAASRFKVIPKDLEYANDYKILNAYCDEVRVMAYDQGRIDLLLNDAKGSSTYYAPVADPAWIRKVIAETAKTINRKKIILGIPTYGYEYQISNDNGSISYKRIRSVSFDTAMELSAGLGIVPQKNSASELSFIYATGTVRQTRLVWFPDAEAIGEKIKLAKSLKLKGVYLFKLDGRADPAMWRKFK